MASDRTPCMSSGLDSTQLWPITLLGSLPTCDSVTVNCLHSFGTEMALVLYCIWSLPVISTAQSAAKADDDASVSATQARVFPKAMVVLLMFETRCGRGLPG